MVQRRTAGELLFAAANHALLAALALLCVLPIVNVLAVSLSEGYYVTAGMVKLWPVGFNLKSYAFVAQTTEFLRSVWVAVQRVAVGGALNMLLTVIVAYPLSKEAGQLKGRTLYVWLFVFTMLFSGGLIPTYVVVQELRLLDTLWALVLPGAVPIFNVILLLNFFRSLPKELEEAAHIDGASHWQTLAKLIVPLSKPALATIALFTIVGHWNEWFSGLIYMNRPENYPLASYLQTVIIQRDMMVTADPSLMAQLAELNNRSVKAAQIFLGALPVFCVYPFLQRYFMTGIVMGSVKE